MNVQKMRKQMARNTPDAVWRTFDATDDSTFDDYNSWRSHWCKMMEIKHKGKRMELTVTRVELLDRLGHVRMQLVAVER